jgi:hypothetical protein
MGRFWGFFSFFHDYASVHAIIGVSLIVKSIQESWLAAFYQYESLQATRNHLKLHRLRFGFWSLMWNHMNQRWAMWLPGVFLIILWLWKRYGSGFWNEISVDDVDDSDVPELEPIDQEQPPPYIKTRRLRLRTEKSVHQGRQIKKKDNESPETIAKRKRERAFQALMAQKEKFGDVVVARPKGWKVYDPVAGKLVLANPDE